MANKKLQEDQIKPSAFISAMHEQEHYAWEIPPPKNEVELGKTIFTRFISVVIFCDLELRVTFTFLGIIKHSVKVHFHILLSFINMVQGSNCLVISLYYAS